MVIMRHSRKRRPARFDQARRAKILGVTQSHLSRVLSGERESATLVIRFQQLVESEQKINQGKIMNPSTEWAALVSATMNKHRTTYAGALNICRAEHPDWMLLVSASGRSGGTVQFFNSRLKQVVTPERGTARKEFAQFVNEKMRAGQPYGVAVNAAAREHPEVYAATHSNQGAPHVKIVMPGQPREQFINDGEMPTPVFNPGMKTLFWLPADTAQDICEAGWIGNGSVMQPLNPAKIFAGIVSYEQKKNSSLGNDAAIAQVKAKFPRLWEAVAALANEPV